MSTKTPLIIVGAGIAGFTLAKLWRQAEPNHPLMIITQDDGDFYHKPLLSVSLTKGKTPDDTISEYKKDLANSLNATILTQTKAIDIQDKKKVLVTDRGDFKYSKLIIATGSTPKKLPHLTNALSLNTLDDYRILRPLMEKADTINIIGAGLVGCELANDLLSLNKTIRLVSDVPCPLNGLVPSPIGEALKDAMVEAGIEWYESTPPEADLTIQAIGLQHAPAISDALAVSPNGIIVDAHGKTNLADVYALGDCAEVHGVTLRYIGPIRQQAQAMVQTLLGNPTEISYPALPTVAKTPTFPVVVCRHPWIKGRWEVISDHDGIQMEQFDDQNKLIGFALGGNATQLRMQYQLPAWSLMEK